MLIADTQEVISRFIGMFALAEIDPKSRPHADEGDALAGRIGLREAHRGAEAGPGGNLAPEQSDPRIDYANDRFEIVRVMTAPVEASGVEVKVPGIAIGQPAFGLAPDAPAMNDPLEAPRIPVLLYRDIPGDSLDLRVAQTAILDDRDTLLLDADRAPLEALEAVARTFAKLVEIGDAVGLAPSFPHDTAEMKAALATSAFDDPATVGQGPAAPTGHLGIYLDGEPTDILPDIDAVLQARLDRIEAGLEARLDPQEGHSTLDTGANLVANDAAILNVGNLGAVSVVLGDWHEINSIRQINLYSEETTLEGIGGATHLAARSQAWNIAEFQRIDATPGPAPIASGLSLPGGYLVDVIEGDLEISNFLSQLNLVSDGDRMVLTGLETTLAVSSGGNQTIDIAGLLKSLGEYDLVVVGGSVYEGNFIQQINLMSDSDRIVGEDPGAFGPDAGALQTGGNTLMNLASIANYGSIGDVSALTSSMDKLVAALKAHDTIGDVGLGADLAFLGSGVRVLYITGDLYEMNVVSQMNVVDDSDTVLLTKGRVADFVETAGPNATWSIATGGNVLLNKASIVDVDDAAFTRFMGGHYYSDSMLLQAGLVGDEDDFATFDVEALVPELIAFMTDDDPGTDDASAGHHAVADHFGVTDGVAGILA